MHLIQAIAFHSHADMMCPDTCDLSFQCNTITKRWQQCKWSVRGNGQHATSACVDIRASIRAHTVKPKFHQGFLRVTCTLSILATGAAAGTQDCQGMVWRLLRSLSLLLSGSPLNGSEQMHLWIPSLDTVWLICIFKDTFHCAAKCF